MQLAKTKLGADMTQIMNSLLQKSDLSWRKYGKPLDHSAMTEIKALIII